ncbi:MAG: FHA domain-containing protein, partial [Myxococcaceae bacterium]
MRPSANSPRPVTAPAEPVIPASELVKRPPIPAPPPAASAKFGVTVIAGPAKGQRFRLPAAGAQVGRSKGTLLFPDDPTVSAHHATFSMRGPLLVVRDESSVSGVLVTVAAPTTIAPNTLFSAGSHLFRYAGSMGTGTPPAPGRPIPYGAPVAAGQPLYLVEELLIGGRAGRSITTAGPLFTIGHSKCDFVLPQEEGLAAVHCELSPAPAGAVLK